MKRRLLRFLALFLLSLCFSACTGYRFSPYETVSCPITVSIPYICGDTLGIFTDELIHALAASGKFVYRRDGADVTLTVAIASRPNEKIGYNYDVKGRDNPKRLKNLIGTEGRSSICAQVSVTDTCTGACLVKPQVVTGYADYDYADYRSIKDLSYVNPKGVRQSSIAFSLGQLDTFEGAQADVAFLLYREVARKIVAALLACDL